MKKADIISPYQDFPFSGSLSADYITGKLTPGIYTKDCTFVDPTTNVQGVETYSKAVASLFDKDDSRADLISIEVIISPC